jgi:HD-like signal output (HDOD) protein
MCGLLHDIGKLLLLKLSRDFIKHGVPTPSAEMGALLMRHWKLPEALVEPVQFRHDPDSAPTHTREATITYVANRLSHRYGFGCPTDDANLLEDEIAVRAGLTESMLGDLDRRAPGLFQVARQIVA